MSDTQAAMREFRFLDDKRKTNGLTPTEEQRWQELATALGMDLSASQQPAGYYGEDGQWYPYPEGYDPNAAAWGYPGYGYPQQPQGYYGPDGQWYPYPAQAPYDPNAAYGYPPGYGYPPPGAYPPPGYDPTQWAAWQAQQQYPAQGEWPAGGPPEGGAWAPPVDPSGGWSASAPGQGLPPSAPGLGLPSLPMPAPSTPSAPALGLPSLPLHAPSAPSRPAPPAAPAPAAPWRAEPEAAPAARGPSLSPFGPPIMGGSLKAKLAGAAPPSVPAPPEPEPLPAPPAPMRSSDSVPEVRTDDVMEISDEEVLDIPVTAPPVPKRPAAEPPKPLAAPASEDPVADLRSALSMDDELDFGAELSPEPSPPAPAPREVARPAPPPPPVIPPPVAPPVAERAAPPALGLDDDVAPTDVALPSASGKPAPAAVAEARTDELSLDVPFIDATAPVLSSTSGITQIEAATASAVADDVPEDAQAIPLLELPPTQAEVPTPARAAVAEDESSVDASVVTELAAVEASVTPVEPVAAIEATTVPEVPAVASELPELEGEAVVEAVAEVHAAPAAEPSTAITTPVDVPVDTSWGEPATVPGTAVAGAPEPIAPSAPTVEVAVEPTWDAAPAPVEATPSPLVEVAAEPAWDAPAPAAVNPPAEVPVEPAWDVPSPAAVSPSVEVAAEPAWDATMASPAPPSTPAEEALPEAVLGPAIDELPVLDAEPAPTSALAGLALAPETAPLPAQAAAEKDALFGQAWSEAPEPEPAPRDTSAFGAGWSAEPEPELPVASPEAPVVIPSAPPPLAASKPSGDVIFASNWDDVPEVGAPAPAAQADVVFASSWSDAPPDAPASKAVPTADVPDEWSSGPAAPSDKVELASTSDFVSWEQAPVVGEEESLSAPQDAFVVESSSAAELANDFHSAATSSVSEEKLQLADNADFLQHQQLTQTGEAWTSDGRGIDVEPMLEAEVELEGEIIQGTAVEDDVPAEPTDSWGAAVSQPSPAPQPPPMRVPPLATPAPPTPAVAAPPPRPAPAPLPPAPAVPPLSAAPPLQVRVATPIAAPAHGEIHPPPQHPPLESAVPPSGPVPMLNDPFDRTGAPLSGESSAVMLTGEHRVILHTLEGQVKRGSLRDLDLCAPTVVLVQPSGDPEPIARERIKAVFFMLTPGGRPPAAEGAKVRVTFKDGRQVAGFSTDYQSAQAGFFVVPADNRTNTARIFIYRHGLQSVTPE